MINNMSFNDLIEIIWRFCLRKKVFNWLRWGSVIIAILLLILNFNSENSTISEIIKWFTSLLVLLQMIIAFSDNKLQIENSELTTRLLRLKNIEDNLETIFNVWLQYILEYFELDASWRVSLYIFDDRGKDENDRFLFVSRYSKDPQFIRKGRNEFKVNQGIIGKAWQNNKCSKFFKKDISEAEYVDILVNKYNFSFDEASALRMKSKSILGNVILNNNHLKVGIVILESINFLNKEKRLEMNEKFPELIDNITPYLSGLLELYSDNLLNQERLG